MFQQVICRFALRMFGQDRFDVVVAELLDAGGLGEKIVPFLRHAKSRLRLRQWHCFKLICARYSWGRLVYFPF